MSEMDYKPNSHKYKDENKKVEKVVTGAVKTRKKTEVRKLADIFISRDMNSVKEYVLMDVLVPAIKKAVSDIIKNGTDMILYGETRKSGSTSANKVSYRNYYDNGDSHRRVESARRTSYDYKDVVLETRGEAEEVLTRMEELIDTYGTVSVADLYDLVGTSCNYTDNKYGWTNLNGAAAVRVADGYLIKLPRVLPL